MPLFRRVLLTAGVLLAFGFGCADSALADPIAFNATFTANATFAPGGGCAALRQTFTGAGVADFLGSITVAQTQCFNPLASDPLAFTGGVFTLTGANGNTLSGVFNGSLVPTATTAATGIFNVSSVFTVTGGTGIFAGASGGGTGGGQFNLVTGAANLTLTGSVTAPIPEPTAMLLLGTGLLTVASVARRRRRSGRAEGAQPD